MVILIFYKRCQQQKRDLYVLVFFFKLKLVGRFGEGRVQAKLGSLPIYEFSAYKPMGKLTGSNWSVWA